MNGLMGSFTKISTLKEVVKEVISQPLPEGATRDIGLRVYGAEREDDCKALQDGVRHKLHTINTRKVSFYK